MIIKINYDFSTGNELSFGIGRTKNESFETNVLDFFSFDHPATNVIVRKENGEYISRNELLQNTGEYTFKQIRKEHNIHRMLLSDSFRWKKPQN